MLNKLVKLAARSAQLRGAVLQKEAFVGGLLSAIGKGALSLGGMAARNPGKALSAGLGVAGTAAGVKGAVGKAKQYDAGFKPEMQQAMLGAPPTPPGAY